MNRLQKEVQQAFIDSEKSVLKELEASYRDALIEIDSKLSVLLARQDVDLEHVIYQVEHQKALRTQVQSILEGLQAKEFETLSGYFTRSYTDGFLGTMYDIKGQGIPLIIPIDQKQVLAAIQHETKLSAKLYTELGHDIGVLQKNIAGEISRGIASGMGYPQIARNIANYAKIPKNRAMTIARTESHRIQCKATSDAQFEAKKKGADVVKQWDAALDGDTRPNHRQLDGQIRELEERFEVGKFKPRFPGDFGEPGEDCNCRCALLQRARWALDESELETLKERAEYFGLDKTKDFEDYKKKYLKASEQEQASGGTKVDLNNIAKAEPTFMQKKETIYNNEQQIVKLYSQKKDEELKMLTSSSLSDMETAQKNAQSISKKIDELKAENDRLQQSLGVPKNAKERFHSQAIDFETLSHDVREDELPAVGAWTRTDYTFINDYLRNGNKGVRPESIENANTLKKMIDRNIVQEPFTVKRGTDFNAMNHLFGSDNWTKKEYNVAGKVIVDKGFVATTPDLHGGFGGGIQMYIDVPKGAKGVYLGDLSAAPDEKEFLLQCGTQFSVEKIEAYTDKFGDTQYDVYLRVITDE